MSDPLVLLVILGAGGDPTTDGMMAAARRALGSETIVIADTSEPSTDRDALAIGARVGARAIARLSWTDGLAIARLHVHVGPSDEWSDDEISFLPQDAPNEKGRTIGYMLASMVQRLERERPEETPAPPSPPPPPPREPAADTRPHRATTASNVDLFGNAIGALGSRADALGGAGGVRWWPSAHVGMRAALGARTGSIREADAAATALFASAGPSYRVALGKAIELGVRSDFVLFRHSVTRTYQGLETTRSRWLGAVDLVFEAGWSIHSSAALIAGVGSELAFGTTELNVGGATMTDIAVMRGIAELGARFRF